MPVEQVSSIRTLPKGYAGEAEKRFDNPEYLLFHIYGERGFNLRFEPRVVTDELLPDPERKIWRSEPLPQIDIFCDDRVQNRNLHTRLAIVKESPVFKLLLMADKAYSHEVATLKDIAEGEFLKPEVQMQVPGAEHTGLEERQLKACLALAYKRQVQYEQRRIANYQETPLGWRSDYGWQVNTEEERAEIIQGYAELQEEAREKMHGVGVNPLSAVKMRNILKAVVIRAEGFITGRNFS